MHRASGLDKLPQLDEEKAKEVLKLAKEVFEKKQTGFELQKETMAILSPGKTCCQMLSDLFDFRHITKYRLEELTPRYIAKQRMGILAIQPQGPSWQLPVDLIWILMRLSA